MSRPGPEPPPGAAAQRGPDQAAGPRARPWAALMQWPPQSARGAVAAAGPEGGGEALGTGGEERGVLEAPEPSRAGGAGGEEEEEPERAGGRPGGGGGMAEPSGAETRPPIRVTVKTPKDKEEIVICDRASVKEVLRASGGAQRRGPRREGGGSGRPGAPEGLGEEGGGPAGLGSEKGGEAGRGRPARVSWGSVARVLGKGGRGLPCGLDWGRGGEWGGGHLALGRGKDPGLAPRLLRGVRGAEAEWVPGKVLSRESGRGGAAETSGAYCAPGRTPRLLRRPGSRGRISLCPDPSCSFQSRWLHLVLSPPGFTQCAVGAQ